jgi:hypothetical protein
MRIDLLELEKSEGRRLSLADVLMLMYELNYGGWQPAIEKDEREGRIYLKLNKCWATADADD